MKTIAMLAATAALATVALAMPASADIVHKRLQNQDHRIDMGVRNGDLTRGEAMLLRAQQMRIRALVWTAERDGKITARERNRILAMQDRASKRIRNERHDDDVRGYRHSRNDDRGNAGGLRRGVYWR
jgi:uncharacterized membrane protein YebE (DUF533 family)